MAATAAFLLLKDGSLFLGKSVGQPGLSVGELCFNTGMTGYQEVYTDPSYYGQIVVNTHSHIGNYGVMEEESESAKVQVSGVVMNQFSGFFSRSNALCSLEEYFTTHNLVAISEIDTRKVVRHIRQKGAMNAVISSENTPEARQEADKLLNQAPPMSGLSLVSEVSTKSAYDLGAGKYKVAVLDFGVKRHILHNLVARDCLLRVFPHDALLEQILDWQPDAFLLSNGPGDPAAMPETAKVVAQILALKKPVLGICLGHQLIAASQGVGTYKMHRGHRGLNHPVKNLLTGRSEITSQNHGFAIDAQQLAHSKTLEITHINLNDQTVEGIRLKDRPVFSVQYHPEASPGPHDAHYLFDRFLGLISAATHRS